MAFPKRLLTQDENIILDLRPHWIALVGPVVVALLVFGVGGWLIAIRPDGFWGKVVLIAVLVVGVFLLVVYCLRTLIKWGTSHFVVTNERVIHRQGLISKTSMEIPLDRIQNVRFHQGIFERMIGAGDVILESAGETGTNTFSDIRHPEQTQKVIYEHAEVFTMRMQGGVRQEASPSMTQELQRLADLRDRGAITEDEFQAQKAKLLGAGDPGESTEPGNPGKPGVHGDPGGGLEPGGGSVGGHAAGSDRGATTGSVEGADGSPMRFTLRNGAPVVIRPILPEDKERLVEGFAQLSETSRYQRFGTPVQHLTDEQVRYLTEIDYEDHMAWVALDPNREGQPGLGVARYVRLRDEPTVAEAAVTVVDSHQGLGLGSILLAVLGLSAVAHGIRAFRAYVLEENQQVQELFLGMGAAIRHEGAMAQVDVPLPEDPKDLPDTPTGRVFRGVATRMLPPLDARYPGIEPSGPETEEPDDQPD
jgi:membrane protein YdbS with pleckstrin-like domain/GNAT superfamily N-acetyltransferase